jgi:hypothetical protein
MSRRPVTTVKKGDRFIGPGGVAEGDGPYTAASDARSGWDSRIVLVDEDDRTLGFTADEWITDWSA